MLLFEHRKETRPKLSDLRESGDMEQDADIVLLLDRPEKEGKDVFVHDNTPCKGLADIIISKNRNGPLGFQRVAFNGEYSDFGQVEQRYEEPPDYMKPKPYDSFDNEVGF